MAKKPKKEEKKPQQLEPDAHILGAGEVENQLITDTIETNFMPYAMSVIMSRAIPEIDGFKPSHRKLLYTMYKMGLLTGARTKSANIVGRTMQLNPHGDGPIYDTMVRLSRGNESLLHPYVDSKGNFGKAYSKNMAYAASRYTEAKLDSFAGELFRDIDKDTVDFVPNYDNTMNEPTLLPVTFPNILVNENLGIAVGMASNICSFNLEEVCNTTIALIKDPDHKIPDTLLAPDFVGGGRLIYDRKTLEEIYETGRGSFKIRSKYSYDKANNCIDISQIPPSTNVEAIIDKLIELVKSGKLREVSDVRDETDKTGLKITIDLKRGVKDPDALMLRLYRSTPLESNFACNFNILVGGNPMVLGVKAILEEWIAFRAECIKRRTYFDLIKAKVRLHLLRGLQKILLDIDKAIKIIRNTEEEQEVVPNLMIGFGIDEIQAEYVAEIRLRHLNREYILKRTEDISRLEAEIADMEDILKNKQRIKKIMITEMQDVVKKYKQPRRTEILYEADEADEELEETLPDYPVHLFFSREGYLKKITPQSLRMSSEQKLKEGDAMILELEGSNNNDLLFFTNHCNVYKAKASDFDDTKASVLGDYVATSLEMEPEETAIYMAVTTDYSGYMLYFFENGKVAKINLSGFYTKTNRRKLVKAYSDKAPLAAIHHIADDGEFVVQSTAGRILLLNSAMITAKATKDSQGVNVMSLKKGHRLLSVHKYIEGQFEKPQRYRTKSLPAAGATLAATDTSEQLSLL